MRPPVQPAGMAKGNCETIRPGIGLSADRSPAKNLTSIKMPLLSKIAWVEPSSYIANIGPVPLSLLPISDLSRFPGPCPAFLSSVDQLAPDYATRRALSPSLTCRYYAQIKSRWEGNR